MDTVRPNEHAAAETSDLYTVFVKVMNGIGIGTETARSDPARTAVGRPHAPTIRTNGNAVGAAPSSGLAVELRPIANDRIRIITVIDRFDVLGLRQAGRYRQC